MNTAISLLAAGAFALGSTAAGASDQTAGKQPQFQPLAGAATLKRGESLKPKSGEPELPPIITQTRLRVGDDGSIEHICEVHPAKAAPAEHSDHPATVEENH